MTAATDRLAALDADVASLEAILAEQQSRIERAEDGIRSLTALLVSRPGAITDGRSWREKLMSAIRGIEIDHGVIPRPSS
jgi:hypothetical protein